MNKKSTLDIMTRIRCQVQWMVLDASAGKWRKETEKFDAEQAKKDQVAQANKAIKDRRGIK